MNFSADISSCARVCALALLLVAGARTNVSAQLRPLDPTDFRVLDGERAHIQVGVGIYHKQHASLVGTKGRLVEAGDIRASWRSGRIVVELAGTLQRFYREQLIVDQRFDGVTESSQEGTRHDAGDYRVQTVLRLTGDTSPTAAVLRFGTRLPTTDNRVGLERDQTDFFASLGASRRLGPLHFAAEAGVGINGTRLSTYEQTDVLIYAATIERRGELFSPFVAVVGQNDMHEWELRGNEDLGEVRAGVRLGSRRWLNATVVRGYHNSSPQSGLLISAGASFGR
jgi:hypothetical protein